MLLATAIDGFIAPMTCSAAGGGPTSKRPDMPSLAIELKSLARRALGIPDPWGDFRRLLRTIHPDTWRSQHAVYDWLNGQRARVESENEAEFLDSPDPVIRHGRQWRNEVIAQFRDKYADRAGRFRLLLFVPAYEATAAGHSLFMNLAAGFRLLGLPTACWHQGEPLAPHLDAFTPTVLLANDGEIYDPADYLSYFDWNAIWQYRRSGSLTIGLVASPYPKTAAVWSERLAHARRLGVDFYYCFQASSFSAHCHRIYREHGFPVLSLEFGANPLVYYPVAGVKRDLDYVFLGSAHFEKWEQYTRFFRRVVAEQPGLIAGPGWGPMARMRVEEPLHRYLYARAKVGLNLHVPFQLDDASELNERAYNLAACGVPQLTDAPRLLPERFRAGSLFVGATPAEYSEQYLRILNRPDEAQQKALSALEDVLTRHTIFHRAQAFVDQLDSHNLGHE